MFPVPSQFSCEGYKKARLKEEHGSRKSPWIINKFLFKAAPLQNDFILSPDILYDFLFYRRDHENISHP